jgi:hypothetical protein
VRSAGRAPRTPSRVPEPRPLAGPGRAPDRPPEPARPLRPVPAGPVARPRRAGDAGGPGVAPARFALLAPGAVPGGMAAGRPGRGSGLGARSTETAGESARLAPLSTAPAVPGAGVEGARPGVAGEDAAARAVEPRWATDGTRGSGTASPTHPAVGRREAPRRASGRWGARRREERRRAACRWASGRRGASTLVRRQARTTTGRRPGKRPAPPRPSGRSGARRTGAGATAARDRTPNPAATFPPRPAAFLDPRPGRIGLVAGRDPGRRQTRPAGSAAGRVRLRDPVDPREPVGQAPGSRDEPPARPRPRAGGPGRLRSEVRGRSAGRRRLRVRGPLPVAPHRPGPEPGPGRGAVATTREWARRLPPRSARVRQEPGRPRSRASRPSGPARDRPGRRRARPRRRVNRLGRRQARPRERGGRRGGRWGRTTGRWGRMPPRPGRGGWRRRDRSADPATSTPKGRRPPPDPLGPRCRAHPEPWQPLRGRLPRSPAPPPRPRQGRWRARPVGWGRWRPGARARRP